MLGVVLCEVCFASSIFILLDEVDGDLVLHWRCRYPLGSFFEVVDICCWVELVIAFVVSIYGALSMATIRRRSTHLTNENKGHRITTGLILAFCKDPSQESKKKHEQQHSTLGYQPLLSRLTLLALTSHSSSLSALDPLLPPSAGPAPSLETRVNSSNSISISTTFVILLSFSALRP